MEIERSYFVRTILDDPEDERRYYWLDMDSADNRIHLYSGYRGEDGKKQRETEEDAIVFDHGLGRNYRWTDEQVNEYYNWMDEIMEKVLGFLPDYEIN